MSRVEPTTGKTKGLVRFIAPFTRNPLLHNRILISVSLAVFAAYTGIGMVGPVRVLYAESHGASLAIIGAMASGYLISNFVFQYPVGWLADRWGHKQVMLVGLLAQAILSAIYVWTTDPISFVVLRFFEGIAAAALLPPARALINDAISEEQQGEAYGVFSAFFNGGFLLGPGIGGALASLGYAVPFIGAVVFRLLAVVIVVLLIHVPKRAVSIAGEKRQTSPRQYRLLFTLPLVAAYLITFGDYLYLGFDMTLMPLWMHDHLGATVAIIGLSYMLWAIPNMVLSPLGGRLADKRRRSTLILIFGLAQVPLYILYGLATTWVLVVVVFAAHGIVYAFIQPAVDSHVAASSSSSMRGGVQGLYATFGLFGAFVGNSGFGPLYQINFHLPLLVIGLTYGIFVLLGGLMIRRVERRKLQRYSSAPLEAIRS